MFKKCHAYFFTLNLYARSQNNLPREKKASHSKDDNTPDSPPPTLDSLSETNLKQLHKTPHSTGKQFFDIVDPLLHSIVELIRNL